MKTRAGKRHSFQNFSMADEIQIVTGFPIALSNVCALNWLGYRTGRCELELRVSVYRPVAEFCDHGNEHSVSNKCEECLWLVDIEASEEGLCCIGLVRPAYKYLLHGVKTPKMTNIWTTNTLWHFTDKSAPIIVQNFFKFHVARRNVRKY
jgi:hypothetical protein